MRKSIWHIGIMLFYLVLFNLIIPLVLPKTGCAQSGDVFIPAPEAQVVADIVINISSPDNEQKKLLKIAENLIYLKKFHPFSQNRLEDSIQALTVCKRFSSIHVDAKDTPKGLKLIFSLSAFRFIKKINITGEQPVFEKKILSALTVYTGDALLEADIDRQSDRVEKLFIESGFVDPKIHVTTESDPRDNHVVLNIDIQKEKFLSLKEISFTGNHNFSSTRLKMKMSIWRHSLVPGTRGRFIETDLKKDIKMLTQFYRQKKYANANVQFTTTKDLNTFTVSVTIFIEEGPRYDVRFEGNKQFWNQTLRKDLVIFRDGNANDLGLKKCSRKIKERYRNMGYLKTEIKLDDQMVTENQMPVRRIGFIISEGPQSRIDRVIISGAQQFAEDEVKKQMLTRPPGFLHPGNYVPETLETDAQAIKTIYTQNGFTDTQVQVAAELSEDKQKAAVSVQIDQGPETIVATTEIKGLSIISEDDALKNVSLLPGVSFKNYMIKSDQNSISSLISPYGYPHVRVTGKANFSADKTKAYVIYKVDEGSFTKMGQIYYSGNFRTHEDVVAREIEMCPGEPFSLKRMLKGQKKIRDMAIFDSVKFKTIGLKENAEDVHLFVEMEEKKPYYFYTGMGYQSDVGMYLNAKLGDRNFLGRNKDLWIGGSTSQIGYRIESWYSEPRFIGTTISTSAGVYAEKKEALNQNFGVDSYGASVEFKKKWTDHLTAGLRFNYENRENYEIDDREVDETDINDDEYRSRNIFVLTPSVAYDTRDSAIRPTKGIFSMISTDISQGIGNDLDSLIKYQFDGRCFYTPNFLPRLTLAFLGRFGYIDPMGDENNIPDDQLFYLGGIADVRGYKENMLLFDDNEDPVGGRSSMVTSLEARFDLGGNFELTSFLDLGKITDTEISTVDDRLRKSVGMGIRYITPIGPIGFLYGHKLDKKNGEGSGLIHFSLGYSF